MNENEIDYVAIQKACRAKPLKFLNEILGVTTWKKQQEIVEAVFKYARVVVKSCNSGGKSWTAAHTALTFSSNYQDSIVVTTAPTGNQVFNVMWREIRGAYSNSKFPLGGELLKQSLSFSDNWYMLGFSTDNPDNARGFHAKAGHLLYVVDEVQGMAVPILDAIEGTLTSDETRLLYIGNPTCSSGPFFDAFSSPFFHKISITAFDTPNFVVNGIESTEDLKRFKSIDEMDNLVITHPYLVTPKWAYMRLHEWGEDSPMYQSLVCAEFPTESDNILIPLKYIEYAMKNEQKPDHNVRLGCDIARYGSDYSVVVVMSGDKMIGCEFWNGKDLMETVGRIVAIFNDYNARIGFDTITIDDTGLGGGVSDRLIELGYIVNRENFGSRANDSEKFFNRKAELFWMLRQKFVNHGIEIKDVGKIVRHTSIIEYQYRSDGKLYITSKDEMKRKGFESTDFADALALAVGGGRVYNHIENEKAPTVAGNLMSTTL